MAAQVEEEVEKFVTVPSANMMSDDIFIKHMNRRHTDSLGGLESLDMDEITPHQARYLTNCWRSFHARLHQVRIDLAHDHAGELCREWLSWSR